LVATVRLTWATVVDGTVVEAEQSGAAPQAGSQQPDPAPAPQPGSQQPAPAPASQPGSQQLVPQQLDRWQRFLAA
jgi:hypothetical protein